MQNNLKHLKFIPKIWAAILFLVLLGVVGVLFSGRKAGFWRIEGIIQSNPEFYTHISNFAISYMLYVGVGYFWILLGVRFRFLVWFGLGLIAINFLYELWIPILNTPDVIDGVYGLFGVLIGAIVLGVIKGYGVRLNG